MKLKSFFNLDHAQSYLNGGIIRYRGEPFMVMSVNRGKRCHAVSLMQSPNTSDQIIVDIDDPELDMNPVPLGFMNFSEFERNRVAVRTARIPQRGWKVGLTESNLLAQPVSDGDYVPRRRDILWSTHLKDTIRGKFPKYERAVEILGKSKGSVAFGRKFAIKHTGSMFHLFHKKPIGKFKASGDYKLDKDFTFLKESLDKEVSR